MVKPLKRQKKENYASQTYWDERYEGSSGHHEWYYTYDHLRCLLDGCFTAQDSVLEIGCGDSPLLHDVAEAGHDGDLVGIDFSPKIIEFVQRNNNKSGKAVRYLEMDARALQFPDRSFDCVIDKGTCDAMLCSDEDGFANVSSIFSEIVRVLKSEAASSAVVVSHMEPESEQWLSVLQECVLPALDERREVLWRIEAHVQEESTSLAKKKKRKSEEAGGATVYVIHSIPKRFTRNMLAFPQNVPFEILCHGEG